MRQEFPGKVRAAAFDRSGGKCEACGAKLIGSNTPRYDHRVPDAVGGQPTLENCQVLCRNCHGAKTEKQDVPAIARTKRIRRKHINAADKSRGFRKPPLGYDPWRRRMTGEGEI